MAEIHVEPRRRGRLTWLWVVIALLIIVGLIWYFFFNGRGGPSIGMTHVPVRELPQHLVAHAAQWTRARAA